MPLILAIEPDRRQAAQLSVVVRKRVQAELILVDTTERALDAIGTRMPDLVLVPALLSPQDDAALAAALRVIAAAARVQMLTIPVLGAARPAPSSGGGMLSALRRVKPRAAEPDGCDPAVFAEQIASYLERVPQDDQPATAVETAPADFLVEAETVHATAFVEEEAAPDVATPDAGTSGQDWLESSLTEVQESVAAPESDESVSLALEEVARALFADPMTATPELAPPIETGQPADTPSPSLVEAAVQTSHAGKVDDVSPVNNVSNVGSVDRTNTIEKDEWVAVDELLAALQLMPLPAVEATDPDEWLAPVLDQPPARVEKPERAIDEAASHDRPRPPVAAAPAGAKSEREWVALIESLRHDVERLRVERAEPPGRKPATVQIERSDRKAKPPQDEWGFFDPEQCGFAALLAKLEEVTEDEGRVTR